jgi:hypothetical protein
MHRSLKPRFALCPTLVDEQNQKDTITAPKDLQCQIPPRSLESLIRETAVE